MGKKLDLVGHRFGRLTVLARDGATPSGAKWLCECSCNSGLAAIKYTTQLRRGGNPGCSACETERRAEVHRTHGDRGTALYTIWKSMRGRCRDVGHTSYPYYGGKGVSVDPVWDDFAVFRAWAEAHGWQDEDVTPAERMSIDRIDSSDNYTPKNCQWLTRSENSKRMHH